jgi:hypothetical protein
MKRKESTEIGVNNERIVIRASGAVEATDCNGNFLGLIPSKMLDRIIGRAEEVQEAAKNCASEIKGEIVTYYSPDGVSDTVASAEWQPTTLEVNEQDLQKALRQSGETVMVGQKIDRKKAKNMLLLLQASNRGPHTLLLDNKLNKSVYGIQYMQDGSVEFGGERSFDLYSLKRIQKLSHAMRGNK